MKVKILKTIASDYKVKKGFVYDLPEEVAKDWVKAGYAAPEYKAEKIPDSVPFEIEPSPEIVKKSSKKKTSKGE